MTNLRRSLTLLAFAIAATLGVHPHVASAACASSMPYTFTNVSGTYSTVDANTTNSNNTFLLACAKNVDNTQIGTAGIYASQIIPTTTGQATFGGSVGYTFPAGISATTGAFSGAVSGTTGTFSSGLSGSTGSFSNAVTATTYTSTVAAAAADAFVWNNYASNTTAIFATNATIDGITANAMMIAQNGGINLLALDNSGDVAVAGSVNSVGSFNNTGLYNTCGTVGNGCVWSSPGSQPFYINLISGGPLTMGNGAGGSSGTVFNTNGTAVIASTLQANGSYVPPFFTVTSTAVGSTFHGVFAQCTTSASNSCTITLSGAKAFSSSTSWGCGVSAATSFASNTPSAQIVSGTSATFSYTGSPGNNTLTGICLGT